MKRKRKIIERLDVCFNCGGRGEVTSYTGEGEDGYANIQCGACSGTGTKKNRYAKCHSCGHEELYFSPATRRMLDLLTKKK